MVGCWGLIAGLLFASAAATSSAAAGHSRRGSTVSSEYAEARALFEKLWQPGEASAAGGDGLGPLFNENSCVGCHHLGGVGGAGTNDRNITLVAAFVGAPRHETGDSVFRGELEELHPGFRNHTTIVLHAHATTFDDEDRLRNIRTRDTVQTRDALVALATSRRNTPALFGDGLLDRITDQVLLDAEKRTFAAFPEIKGRASRLRDGRLGRFGWKGQTATLRDFVLGACATELGLEVPGHHQASLLPQQRFEPSKLRSDLTDAEVNLLVGFVATLPRPVLRPVDTFLTSHGPRVFEAVGCGTCHAARLGPVGGVYSDLLLHDLGDRFVDFASGYYGGASRPPLVVDRATAKEKPATAGEAAPTEWRTAPLWGVADSAPYLHDGRAGTLDEAIRLHGGEASETARRYAKLPFNDRQSLLAFLHSLRAPGSAEQSPVRHPKRSR
jgi:CxxC motif-containing protein (DUF1111 family)